MTGLTREQYQTEKRRRTTRWQTELVATIDGLLGRIEQFHRAHDEHPVLTYDEHRQLEALRKDLRIDRFLLDTKWAQERPSELQLELTEQNIKDATARLAAFETLLVTEPQPTG